MISRGKWQAIAANFDTVIPNKLKNFLIFKSFLGEGAGSAEGVS
jgi:hypothetical protein